MRNYKGDGNLIALTTPAAIATGAGLQVGGFFGITCKPAGAGEVVECLRAGEFTVTKNSAEAWAVGDTIYWDDTAKLFTTVVASNTQVGFAAAVAANPSATGIVQLVSLAGNVARYSVANGKVTGLVGPDGVSIYHQRRIGGSGTLITAPSDTAENTMASMTVKGGSLGKNGELVVRIFVSNGALAGNLTTRIRLGGAVFLATVYASPNVDAVYDYTIWACNSQNAQAAFGGLISGQPTSNVVVNQAIDLTVDQTLQITMQKTNGADVVQLRAWVAKVTYGE